MNPMNEGIEFNFNCPDQNNITSLHLANKNNEDLAKTVNLPASIECLRHEEIEFNEQFIKWEKEFCSWKAANVNHPNKKAYKLYEQQFMNVRQKLLQRLPEMQKRKLEEKSQVKTETNVSTSTPSQEPYQQSFVSQPQPQPSSSSSSQQSAICVKPKPQKPKPKKNIQHRPPTTSRDFQDDSFDDIQFDSYGSDFSFSNYDFSTSSKTFYGNQRGIPGFDLNRYGMDPTTYSKKSQFVDLDAKDMDTDEDDDDNDDDDEEECYVRPKDPPPLPVFKSTNSRRQILNINDLLEEPGRSHRQDRIMILIRGAPGSGKSYLANLILEREVKLGNNRCISLSTNRYYQRFEPSMADKYQEKLLNELRNEIRDEIVNFIVVEVEGGKTSFFNKFVHIGITMGNFKCHVVELHQTLEACLRYNSNRRGFSEICEARKDVAKFQAPAKVLLLDATPLLAPHVLCTPKVPIPSEAPEIKPPVVTSAAASTSVVAQTSGSSTTKILNIEGIATNLVHLLQDKNVMDFLQSQLTYQQPRPLMSESFMPPPQQQPQHQQSLRNSNMNMNESFDDMVPSIHQQPNFSNRAVGKENIKANFQSMQQQQQEHHLNEYRTFEPVNIIDYEHSHMKTFDEQLMEFKVSRIIDHKHIATHKLKKFVKDVDTDKIIEKSKAVALRKKILKYLKTAERPEDTVSNPRYPRNWEVIPYERPQIKNKRKKRLTLKIKRVLMARDAKWMTQGDTVVEHIRHMGLQEISSDESMPSIESGDDFDGPVESASNQNTVLSLTMSHWSQ